MLKTIFRIVIACIGSINATTLEMHEKAPGVY